MTVAGVAMIGVGVFLLYCAIGDINPWETAKESLNSGNPTIVKYAS